MKYIKWFFFAIADLLFTVICYFTNPIVLLFADEVGNLPSIFLLWENWDDHLDVEWMISEHCVPRWAEYDFNRHYKYYDEWQAEQTIGQHRGYVKLLNPHFTIKERFQRYICRLAWLYRNCGYGFSYYITGVDVNENDIVKIKDEEDYIYYVTDEAWVFKYDRPSFGKYRWEIFMGWKMQNVHGIERCMLAIRINPFQ